VALRVDGGRKYMLLVIWKLRVPYGLFYYGASFSRIDNRSRLDWNTVREKSDVTMLSSVRLEFASRGQTGGVSNTRLNSFLYRRIDYQREDALWFESHLRRGCTSALFCGVRILSAYIVAYIHFLIKELGLW
jgi:hypothetical protein